jgi:hypothetical protein
MKLAADPAVRSSVLVAVILACLIFLCRETLDGRHFEHKKHTKALEENLE